MKKGTTMTKAETKRLERQEALRELQRLCPPGTTVYTVLRGKPSRSGMARNISLITIIGGLPCFISSRAATVLEMRMSRYTSEASIVTPGGGMDMGFHLVHGLSYALHGVEKTDKIDPGYSLDHRWL